MCVCVCVARVCVCVCFISVTCVSISLPQAKYHEDFERTRGRSFGGQGLDDPSMDRYQRANQMTSEAGYGKNMDMDRRPGGIIVGQ